MGSIEEPTVRGCISKDWEISPSVTKASHRHRLAGLPLTLKQEICQKGQ